jgi:hypothetical protein
MQYLTPERYKLLTGEPWPDNAAVYYRFIGGNVVGPWLVGVHRPLSPWDGKPQRKFSSMYQVICATEAGPPTDNWEPEEK